MRRPLSVLTLLCPALLAQGTPEAAEPNDTIATATTFAVGAQGYGEIATTGSDEDWFSIVLTSASDLLVWTAPGRHGQIFDTRVRVLAADGTTVLIDADDGNTATHGFYTVFTLDNVAAGTYYVAVRGFDSTTFGTYTLDVVAAPPGSYTPTAVVEAAEENDPRAPAGVATVSAPHARNTGACSAGAINTGFAEVGVDYDFFQFTVTAPGPVLLETLPGAASPALLDTVVHLADASLNRLAFDDDGAGPGSFLSRLVFQLPAAGTYYAVVNGFGSGSAGTGNYILRIATPDAAVTIHAGGCPGSAGTPTMSTRDAGSGQRPEQPVLGSDFYVDGDNLPANAPLFRIIGLVTLASPVNLTVFGAPGCLVEVDPLNTDFGLADANGEFVARVQTIYSPLFVGLPLQQQLAVLDLAGNALGLTFSNRVGAVCGLR